MNSSEKLITILKTLAKPPFEFSITELAPVIDCGRSGTYKLLASLVASGMAEQKANKKYCLGLVSYLIGKSYENHVDPWRFARPYLDALRDELNENVSIALWSDDTVKVLYKAESRQLIRVVGAVGSERPVNASAMGKTLAAYIGEEKIRALIKLSPLKRYTERTITDADELFAEYAKIRKAGYAISYGEFSEDSMGVGAPVYGRGGEVMASVSIGAPIIRADEKKVEMFISRITETAEKISEALASVQ